MKDSRIIINRILLIIAVVFIIMISLSGCNRDSKSDVRQYCNLEMVESSETNIVRAIYVDRNTDILYVRVSSGISPIIDSDGTYLTYTKWHLRNNLIPIPMGVGVINN